MMSKNLDRLPALLKKYDLTEEQIRVLIALYEIGTGTALSIARTTKVSRGSVYRALEELIVLGLVKEMKGPYGAIFESTGISGFEKLVADRQKQVISLRNGLEVLKAEIARFAPKVENATSTTVYKGRGGLEQVLWNQLSAEEVLILETGEMNNYVSDRFAERIRREFVIRGMKMRVLTNETNIKDFTKEREFVRNHWEIRHIPIDEFVIDSELFVCGDFLSHFDFNSNSLLAVEVKDTKLVKYQKSLFNILWDKGKKMVILSPEGRSKLP